MSSPSEELPREPEQRAQSSTQEIPVIPPTGATAAGSSSSSQQPVPHPLPPHPGAVAPTPVAMDEPQPTGPLDFVPGLPGTPPVPPPAGSPPGPPATRPAGAVWPDSLDEADDASGAPERTRRVRAPHNPAAVLGLGLAVLALVLLELGLALHFGARSYWSAVPLWSAFATLCAALVVVALAAAYPSGSALRPNAVWRICAAGLVGLAVFWLLVVLSVVATDRGFLLTAALGALGGALWVGPGRKA